MAAHPTVTEPHAPFALLRTGQHAAGTAASATPSRDGWSPRRPPDPRRVRLAGAVALVIGVLLCVSLALMAWTLAPSFLNPGMSMAGQTFTGTVAQGTQALALMAWVSVLGAIFAGFGVTLLATGRRPPWMGVAALGLMMFTMGFVWQVGAAFG